MRSSNISDGGSVAIGDATGGLVVEGRSVAAMGDEFGMAVAATGARVGEAVGGSVATISPSGDSVGVLVVEN